MARSSVNNNLFVSDVGHGEAAKCSDEAKALTRGICGVLSFYNKLLT